MIADAKAAPIVEELQQKERLEEKDDDDDKYKLDPTSHDPFEVLCCCAVVLLCFCALPLRG